MGEGINFSAFILLAFSTHFVAAFYEKHHNPDSRIANAIRHVPVVSYVIGQPHFWHGVKEYLVHLVVYSGMVIPSH